MANTSITNSLRLPPQKNGTLGFRESYYLSPCSYLQLQQQSTMPAMIQRLQNRFLKTGPPFSASLVESTSLNRCVPVPVPAPVSTSNSPRVDGICESRELANLQVTTSQRRCPLPAPGFCSWRFQCG